jgi:Skp family chaperone for outer membrane proteins
MLMPAMAEDSSSAPQTADRIGVIDIQRVLREYEDHHTSIAKLKEEMTIAAERRLWREQRDQINRLIEQLKTCQPGTPEYRAVEKEVTERQLDCYGVHVVRDLGIKKQLLEMVTAQQAAATATIHQLVAEYANEHELTLVVNLTLGVDIVGMRDITEEIIARVNSPRRR